MLGEAPPRICRRSKRCPWGPSSVLCELRNLQHGDSKCETLQPYLEPGQAQPPWLPMLPPYTSSKRKLAQIGLKSEGSAGSKGNPPTLVQGTPCSGGAQLTTHFVRGDFHKGRTQNPKAFPSLLNEILHKGEGLGTSKLSKQFQLACPIDPLQKNTFCE